MSLLMTPPDGQGIFLRYKYKDGSLIGTKRKNGSTIATDAWGIPI